MDNSPVFDPDLASYYQSLIVLIRWMVEIDRVDFITEKSLLASQLAMPRKGHFDALLNVYDFLQDKYNSRMKFDPTYPEINKSSLKECE